MMFCPACQKIEMDILGDVKYRDFDGSIFNFTGQFYECQSCGFVRMESGLSDRDIVDHYTNNCLYTEMTGVGVGGSSPEDIIRYKHYLKIMQSHNLTHGTYADIGCCQGGFLNHLSSKMPDLNLVGVEVDRSSLVIMEENGIPARFGSVFALPFDNNSLDALSYFHVIEHIYDVDALLEEATRVLKNQGSIIFEVPDACRYGQSDTRVGAQYWISIKEHINHFSLQSLSQYFWRHGLKIKDVIRGKLPMKNGYQYPSLIVIADKLSNFERPSDCLRDVDGGISSYFRSDQIAFENKLENLLSFVGDEDLTFWGIGIEFFNIYAQGWEHFRKRRITLLDANPNKNGLKVDGIPVVNPASHLIRSRLVCSSYVSGSAIYKAALEHGWPDKNIYNLII